LNLIALCNIKSEDELTLDYQELLDDTMDAFACKCGSKNCRKIITGITGNSISNKETQNRLVRSVRMLRKNTGGVTSTSGNGG
jgi:hypothetical protein